jgi:hypothetical protein
MLEQGRDVRSDEALDPLVQGRREWRIRGHSEERILFQKVWLLTHTKWEEWLAWILETFHVAPGLGMTIPASRAASRTVANSPCLSRSKMSETQAEANPGQLQLFQSQLRELVGRP